MDRRPKSGKMLVDMIAYRAIMGDLIIGYPRQLLSGAIAQ
jgi:hypothetical protein